MEVLSDLITREARDPRLEGVVITAVALNDDNSVAKIYYMGGGENVSKGLRNAAPFLRGEVGRYLKMRFAPELRFSYDDSLERYNRLEDMLPETAVENGDDGASDTDENPSDTVENN